MKKTVMRTVKRIFCKLCMIHKTIFLFIPKMIERELRPFCTLLVTNWHFNFGPETLIKSNQIKSINAKGPVGH